MLPTKTPAIRSLTGARFIAALLVVCFHFLPDAPAWANAITRYGYFGVPFFFVLSGFILAYNYASDARQPFSARSFWWARVARIYPTYLLSLVLTLPLFLQNMPSQIPAIGGTAAWDSVVLVSMSATLTHALAVLDPIVMQPNTPGWTLSVEAFFYLVFPVFALWMARMNRRASLLTVLSMLALLAFLDVFVLSALPGEGRLLGMHGRLLWGNHPLAQLPIFIAGAAAARVFILTRESRRLSAISGPAVLAGGALLFAGLAANLPAHFGMFGNVVMTAVFSLLVYFMAFDRGSIARCLSIPAALALGEASYALYILQQPIGGYLEQAYASAFHGNASATPFRVVVVALLVIASLAANRYFETPVRIQLKNWIKGRRRTTRSRPTEALALLPLPLEG